MRLVEHSIKTMIVCCGVLSEELLVKALVPGVLEHKVQLSQVVAVGVDVEVVHCEARHVEHPKLFSKLCGGKSLPICAFSPKVTPTLPRKRKNNKQPLANLVLSSAGGPSTTTSLLLSLNLLVVPSINDRG